MSRRVHISVRARKRGDSSISFALTVKANTIGGALRAAVEALEPVIQEMEREPQE